MVTGILLNIRITKVTIIKIITRVLIRKMIIIEVKIIEVLTVIIVEKIVIMMTRNFSDKQAVKVPYIKHQKQYMKILKTTT